MNSEETRDILWVEVLEDNAENMHELGLVAIDRQEILHDIRSTSSRRVVVMSKK